MAASRSRAGRSIVLIPPGSAGGMSPAARHVVAAETGVPAAFLDSEGRAGRPVFLSDHRGVAEARRVATHLATRGVTAEVHAPGQAWVARGLVLMAGLFGTAGLAVVGLAWLLGAGSGVLASIVLVVLLGTLGVALGPRRFLDQTSVDRDDAERAWERLEHLSQRAPRAWVALGELEATVRDADLPPDAAADLWRALDRVGEQLLAAPSDTSLAEPLEEIRAQLSTPSEVVGRDRADEAVHALSRAARAASATLDHLDRP